MAEVPSTTANSELEQAQAQVNEVIGIMRQNVERVIERDRNLNELDRRAEVLEEGGRKFEQQSHRIKRKYCWQNVKMMIILGVVGVILIIIIAVSITYSVSGDDKSSSSGTKSVTTN